MSWDSAKCVNSLNKKLLSAEARELEQAGYDFIVARWKRALISSLPLRGLLGFRSGTIEKLSGEIESTAEVSEKHTIRFFPDEYRAAFAIVPMDNRDINIKALAALLLDNECPIKIEQIKPETKTKIDGLIATMKAEIVASKAAKEKAAEKKAEEPKPDSKKPTKLSEMVTK